MRAISTVRSGRPRRAPAQSVTVAERQQHAFFAERFLAFKHGPTISSSPRATFSQVASRAARLQPAVNRKKRAVWCEPFSNTDVPRLAVNNTDGHSLVLWLRYEQP